MHNKQPGDLVRLASTLLIFFTSCLLMAQVKKLPWTGVEGMPWKSIHEFESVPPPCVVKKPEGSFGWVKWTTDGHFHVLNPRGTVILRFGLPGRPARIWQDDGIPVPMEQFSWPFPTQTLLGKGIGELPLGQNDFRPALEGLLWIVDDGEKMLTVLHAASSQVLFIPLPSQFHLGLAFFPDRLEVRQVGSSGKTLQGWSLPWINLLPQFIALGKPAPKPKPGTALAPFPPE